MYRDKMRTGKIAASQMKESFDRRVVQLKEALLDLKASDQVRVTPSGQAFIVETGTKRANLKRELDGMTDAELRETAIEEISEAFEGFIMGADCAAIKEASRQGSFSDLADFAKKAEEANNYWRNHTESIQEPLVIAYYDLVAEEIKRTVINSMAKRSTEAMGVRTRSESELRHHAFDVLRLH